MNPTNVKQAHTDTAVSEHEYRALIESIPSVTKTNEPAKVLTADDYFKTVRKRDTRPAFWKYSDVKEVLDTLAAEPLREAERRFCTTVNEDTGDLVGASPFIFIGWQLIHPGEEVKPHRHSSVAIYHILQGRGSTIVQDRGGDWDRYEWERGDTLCCPAWAYHAHYAEGEDDTIMYVVQDLPMMAAARTLFWEEPMGQENIRHMVVGTSPSWSVTRTNGPAANENDAAAQ